MLQRKQQRTKHSRASSKQRILAAAAAIAAAGTGNFTFPRPAQADLTLDLRAISISGNSGTISGDKKSASVFSLGATVTMGVYARISGTNSSQQVIDVSGNGSEFMTINDDSLKGLTGAFSSVGSLKGNMGGNVAGPNNVYATTSTPFNAAGATNGAFADFDSDGDLDLGAIGTDPTNMWAAHDVAPTMGAQSSVSGKGYSQQPFVGFVPNSQDSLIDASTNELRLGTLRFIATAGAGSAGIGFIIRENGDAAALWFEDGISTGKNPTNSTFSAGAPVQISLGTSPGVNLVWNPGSTTWNLSNTNWLDGASSVPFSNGKIANFTNTGVGPVNVDPGGISVSGVSFTHTSGTYTFTGGSINGTGGVTLAAAGTVIFATANGYSGGTTITGGGTLIADGGDNRLGAAGGVITLDNGTLKTATTGITSARNLTLGAGGGTFDTNSLSSAISGVLSGAGALTKRGAGVLTLTGANTYAGGTNIAGGVIQVGNGGTTGSIVGNVINNGGIVFSRSDDLTFAGDISGTGALTQNSSGRLNLTGNNTYSGGSTILDGTLQIGDGGTTGSIAGGIYDGSTLIFNRSDSITYSGAIIAGGEVIQDGAGELNLTGSNSHGATIVRHGTLRVGSNANLGSTGASLDMRGGTTLKLDASISTSRTALLGDGLGTVTMNPGAGQSLAFTGSGSTGISGPINLVSGTLSFNRSGGLVGVGPVSSITVQPGATLNLSGQPIFFDGVDRVDVINNSTASFNVTGGSHDVGQVSGVGNTSISSGATLTATYIRQGTLSLAGTAAIRPNRTASGVSRVNTLAITGAGKFDLGDNKLIVTGMPAGTWNGSAYTGVTALVASGRNGGAMPLWDGTSGVITTQADAVNSNFTSIGVAKASDVRLNTASETTLWAGQTITGTDVLVMYTYGGDANLDGKINIDDYIKIGTGRAAGLSGWSNGDFNYDGKINIDDYVIIDGNIGNQNGFVFPTASGIGGSVVAVPEPAGLLMLVTAAGLLKRTRRREC